MSFTAKALAGKIAVVTSASSGNGRAIFLALAKAGFKAVCSDLQPAHTFERLDIVVNNVGISTGLNNILEETDQDFDRTMSIGTRGAYFGCKSAIKQFLSQSDPAPGTSEDTQSHPAIGKIIKIFSMGSLIGLVREPSYCA